MTDQLTCAQCGRTGPVRVDLVGIRGARYACLACSAVVGDKRAGGLALPSAAALLRQIRRPLVSIQPVFQPRAWDTAYRRRRALALASVPLYRERAAPWCERSPLVSTMELAGNEYRLCPFARPWTGRDEPSLWTGSRLDLYQALRVTGEWSRADAFVEVRPFMVDWQRIERRPFAVLLSEQATVESARWRAEYNASMLGSVAKYGRVAVIGDREELAVIVSPEATATRIERFAVTRVAASRASLVHDPHLGYIAARGRHCGQLHVNWRRYYIHRIDGSLACTDLHRSRPTLVDIDCGRAWALAKCPVHRTPTLVTPA